MTENYTTYCSHNLTMLGLWSINQNYNEMRETLVG